jgi:hypothetical protein
MEQSTIDRDADRPGVPMEAEPEPAEGAHWRVPARQPGSEDHPHHTGIPQATPVVGTAQPLRGLSGVLRRSAYDIPEHYARHWGLLMLADRVDVIESRLGSALSGHLHDAGMPRLARRVEQQPLAAVAVAAGAVWLIRKVL